MNAWLLAAIWYSGGLLTLRQSVRYMRVKHGANWRYKLDRRDGFPPQAFLILCMTIFWPIPAFVLASWKLIFPFGRKGRKQYFKERRQVREDLKVFAGQQRRQAEQRLLRNQEDDYRKALEFLAVVAQDQHAIEAALPPSPIMSREFAEVEFAQWSEQVWNERGKPWHLSASLKKIRIRHQRAVEAANA